MKRSDQHHERASLYPPESLLITRGTLLQAVLANAVINTLIALFLTAIGFGDGFAPVFVFSQSIGMSILFANLAAIPLHRRFARAGIQLLIVIGAIIAGSLFGTLLGAALAGGHHPLDFLLGQSKMFGQIVLLGLLFGSIISYIFISLSRLAEEKVRRLEAEKYGMAAELKLLQSQLEPHFLFNTLSNVLSLIDTEPAKARGMLEAFTAFLRSSLMTTRHADIPLSEEAEIIQSYLAVYSIRMGERLRYRIDIPDELASFSLPPLLVQPLVENAIKHGLEPSRAGGDVSVTARKDGAIVRITVADTGVGMDEMGAGGAGIGLENLRKRLDLLFGERARMSVEENDPTGIKVTIEVPHETSAGDHR